MWEKKVTGGIQESRWLNAGFATKGTWGHQREKSFLSEVWQGLVVEGLGVHCVQYYHEPLRERWAVHFLQSFVQVESTGHAPIWKHLIRPDDVKKYSKSLPWPTFEALHDVSPPHFLPPSLLKDGCKGLLCQASLTWRYCTRCFSVWKPLSWILARLPLFLNPSLTSPPQRGFSSSSNLK